MCSFLCRHIYRRNAKNVQTNVQDSSFPTYEVSEMQAMTSNYPESCPNKEKRPAFLQDVMELMAGFEPATSSLPRAILHNF